MTDVEADTRFGKKVQELVYVGQGELEGWDKTNKALVRILSGQHCDLFEQVLTLYWE